MESQNTPLERTDLTRWRLKDDDSRHTWHYLDADVESQERPQTYAEKYYLGLPLDLPILPPAKSSNKTVENALAFLENLQLPSGHWGCESGGPMTFCAGIVIAWYATETVIPNHVAMELQAYIAGKANRQDGGWGLHTTGASTVCGTAINYIVMRIAGMSEQHPILVRARSFIHSHGGATSSSVWGKFWMAILGIVDWDIVHPMPPEMWLLPEWVPFHPSKFYVEMRLPSQPMAYLSSVRWHCKETDLVMSLRKELLIQPYDDIDWKRHRITVAETDYLHPRSWLVDGINWTYLNIWKPYFLPSVIKSRAEQWLSELIDVQAKNTDYGGIAASDQPMSTIVSFSRDGPESVTFKKYIDKLQEFLWMTKDGMLINSTNGSQSWDTAFILQGICAAGMQRKEPWRGMCLKALAYLDAHQIREDCPEQEKYHRQQRKGCWTFSNKYQGYAVSDCTAEAIKAVIELQKTVGYPALLSDQRIFDAVDSMLLYQNKTGGVSAFEARRGSKYLEWLNVSEMLACYVVEYDYPECTSSCITALQLFKKHWPEYRSREVRYFIQRGIQWIKSDQGANGAWYGSWGVCYTYGTMFGLEALAAVGETYANSSYSQKACDFLISKQREDGGWSESIEGCAKHKYIEDAHGSLVVQTAWALIGLMAGEYPEVGAIRQGIEFLMKRQQGNGEWLEEAIPGSFHGACSFSYPNYKFAFAMRALGMFDVKYSS